MIDESSLRKQLHNEILRIENLEIANFIFSNPLVPICDIEVVYENDFENLRTVRTIRRRLQ